jgi:hypothetical protein
MDELEFAEGVWLVALEMNKLTERKEIVNRFIVSKLYYGAHHIGRLLLKKRGETPDTWIGEVHLRVIKELRSKYVDPGLLSVVSLSYLRELRMKRHTYQLNGPPLSPPLMGGA